MMGNRPGPVTIKKYETLKTMCAMANFEKSLRSRNGDGLVPKEGFEGDFSIWEAHEKNLRELMRKVRYNEEVLI